MRKVFPILIVCSAAFSTACADNEVISQNLNDLPAAARTTLEQHFPGVQVSYIKIDKELFRGTSYEVRLVNGAEISFSGKGEWTEVDGKKNSVPAHFLPDEIRRQATGLFPGDSITQIEKKNRGYEVELSNGIDLTFNRNLELKEID